jgi:hypothetical protein
MNTDFAESTELRNLVLKSSIMQLHRQLPHLAPEKNGINVEGLAERMEGGLLIGLRNPRPQNKAILIPIENPDRVVLGYGEPKFGTPHLLDLGGLGISDLVLHREQGVYYILATPHDKTGGSKLFRWSGIPNQAPTFLLDLQPEDFTAQALALAPDGKRLMVLSDDGQRPLAIKKRDECKVHPRADGACPCNGIVDVGRKQFRGQWVDLPPLPVAARPAASVVPQAAPRQPEPVNATQ